jgi:cytochrome c
MKRTMLVACAALALAAGASNANEELAKASGCLACHNVSGAKKVGPSFKDVAAKYKGKADAQATLTAKLAAGKGHPPVKAKPEDVATLVKWVLAQ